MKFTQIAILPNHHNLVIGIEKDNEANIPMHKCDERSPLSVESQNNKKEQRITIDAKMTCCFGFFKLKCSRLDKHTVKLAIAIIEKNLETKLISNQQIELDKRLQRIEEMLSALCEKSKTK